MTLRKLRRTLELIAGLSLLCALSGYASAEIIDDITLHTDANGEIDTVIKFTVPIQYLDIFLRGNRRLLQFFLMFSAVFLLTSGKTTNRTEVLRLILFRILRSRHAIEARAPGFRSNFFAR
jgi:hypothetical protein